MNAVPLRARRNWSRHYPAARISRRLVRVPSGYARLAKTFTVVAPDLRGVGESAPSETGYEASNLAEDVRQLIVNLGLEQVYVFGHDIGGMVAYAFARRHPESARGVMILDVAFPGLDPWQDILGGQFPERKRPSGRRQKVAEFSDYLHQRWDEGCLNTTRLHQEIRDRGYTGCRSMVAKFVAGWR